jgi:hypothetical protein
MKNMKNIINKLNIFRHIKYYKIRPFSTRTEPETIDDQEKEYYDLTNNIRNFEKLSNDEILLLEKLSIKKLIEIIKIYDKCIQVFRSLYED